MASGRSIQNGVLGVAILGELIFLVGHPLFGWGRSREDFTPTPPPLRFAAPGPPAARDTLLGLAGAAARSRATAPRGRYAYVSRLVWSLADQDSRDAHPSRPLIRSVTSWRAADGAGRRVTVRRTSHGVQTVTTSLGPGDPPPRLTGSQVAIAHRLHLGFPSREPLAAQFVVFTEVYAAEPVSASVRADMLRLLARVPGIVVSGAVTDRLGRGGVAVSLVSGVSGTEVRYTLVFDRRTGGLLESDETLVGEPASPNASEVPNGALVAYTVYGRSGRVARIGAVPAS